ncbi:MAG: hypothetical protein AAGN35_24410 [Bacteroidota bacterium]
MNINVQALAPLLHTALSALRTDGDLLRRVHQENRWFLPELVREAIAAVQPWFAPGGPVEHAAQKSVSSPARRVGIIMAGNLPLVGLHDLVAVLLAGHRARVKLSGKDRQLIPALLAKAGGEFPVAIVDRIDPAKTDFLIATGSDNTARHLEYAYGAIPRLIRKNRFSVAVLTGSESEEELAALARDVLLYHGMGCRSVSNLLVPPDWEWAALGKALAEFPRKWLAEDWFDIVHWENAVHRLTAPDAEIAKAALPVEREQLTPARIGQVHLVRYHSASEVAAHLEAAALQIQCVVGAAPAQYAFGSAQRPAWTDYADGVDVLARLRKL